MSIELPATEKAYYVMVNHPEMVSRAVKQGFEKPILVQMELDDDDIELIMRRRKVIAIYYFAGTDEEENLVKLNYQRMDEMGITSVMVNCRNVLFHEDDDDIKSLADCLRFFPTVLEFEDHLSCKDLILTRNYENRCENCHNHMESYEKYCRKCGTKRGQGKFEPFQNAVYGVYGPAVKIKYKCRECEHIWITEIMGGDDSDYCPQCGARQIDLQQYDGCDNFFGYNGILEPFDEANRPVLLTEQQIDSIIKNKRGIDYISDEDLQSLMEMSGIPVPEQLRARGFDPITETERDRMTLVSRIQNMDGHNPRGYKDARCPNCDSEYAAAIGCSIWSYENRERLDDNVFIDAGTEDALHYGHAGYWQLGKYQPSEEHPAFICLCCGRRYGVFDIPTTWKKSDKEESGIMLPGISLNNE